jgi:hypothetical protein
MTSIIRDLGKVSAETKGQGNPPTEGGGIPTRP